MAKWQQHSKTSQLHLIPSGVASSFTSLRIYHFWWKLGNLPTRNQSLWPRGWNICIILNLLANSTPFPEMRLIPWAGVKFLLYPDGGRCVTVCGQIPMPTFLSTLFLFSRRCMNAGNSYPDVGTLLDRFWVGVLQGSLWSLAISRGQKNVCTPSCWRNSFSHQFITSFPHFLIKCIFTCHVWCFSSHVFF